MAELITNFHFIRPAWLWLLPVAVFVWWLWQQASDPLRGWRQQIDPDLLSALTDLSGKGQSHLRMLVLWGIAIVSVAGPTWRMMPSPFADDAAPLIVLLKSDISMDRSNPAPSRMERAQLKISDLADARKGQATGLIAYAGSSHLVLPPTKDTSVVAQMATEISPEIMPVQGDRLDLALREAGELLKETGGGVLVIADSINTPIEKRRFSHPVQILSLAPENSSEAETLKAASRAIGAKLVPMMHDTSDIEKIASNAGRLRMNQTAESGAKWQEAGFWLVPFLALAYALSFRRETHEITE